MRRRDFLRRIAATAAGAVAAGEVVKAGPAEPVVTAEPVVPAPGFFVHGYRDAEQWSEGLKRIGQVRHEYFLRSAKKGELLVYAADHYGVFPARGASFRGDLLAGVAAEDVAAGTYGWVQVSGPCNLRMKSTS